MMATAGGLRRMSSPVALQISQAAKDSSSLMKATTMCVFDSLRQKTVIIAACMGLLAASFAGGVKYLDQYMALDFLEHIMTDSTVYQSFSFLLGFLVIFYTSNAYQRLVKGGELLYTVMGDFGDLASLTMAFTRFSDAPEELILEFKQDLVRLLSLTFCVGIGRLEEREHHGWRALNRRLLDVAELGEDRLAIIHRSQDDHKPEIVSHMVQSLLVDNIKSGVLSIPAPLLTRVFHELGSASIKLSEIRSYKELPFPQTLVTATHFLLLIHMVTTPYFVASWCEGVSGAAGWTFCIVFSLHLLHQVARELDNPFGTDLNDIDMASLQEEVNETLLSVFVASTPEATREKGRGCMARLYRELKREPSVYRRSSSGDSMHQSYVTWVRSTRSRMPTLDSRMPTLEFHDDDDNDDNDKEDGRDDESEIGSPAPDSHFVEVDERSPMGELGEEKHTYYTWARSTRPRSEQLSRGVTFEWDLDDKVLAPVADLMFEDFECDSPVRPVHPTQRVRVPRPSAKSAQRGVAAESVGASSDPRSESGEAQSEVVIQTRRAEEPVLGQSTDSDSAFRFSSKSGNLSDVSESAAPRAEAEGSPGDRPKLRGKTSYGDYKRRVAENSGDLGANS